MLQAFRNFVDAVCYPFRMLARIPSNIISSPRRMLGLSLPMRAALLLFIGLLLVVIGWALLILTLDGTEQLGKFLWNEVPKLLVLVFVIPVIVWYALKLWLEGEPSPFPDIDRVWKSALAALDQQGINPSETPIFMVMGPSSPEEIARFMGSSNTQYPVQLPQGPAPLHVWANQEAIYVICTEVCCLGNLLSKGFAQVNEPVVQRGAAPSLDNLTGTLQMNSPDGGRSGASFGAPQAGRPIETQTMVGGPFGLDGGGPGPMSGSPANAPSPMLATMQIGLDAAEFRRPVSTNVAAARPDPARSSQAAAKLAYVCRCLRRVRDPLAPINGALIATPFELLADGSQDVVNQLQIALKSDVATLRSATRVRCSVTHVIAGMQEEAGFRELIRRVGTDRVSSQRFGKGFGLWNLPTADQLDAVVKHACGAFEDWSYVLFRDKDGFGKRGNRQLYGLLCRIRLKFLPRLEHLIRSGYAVEPNSPTVAGREPMLFSGCYFVANGQTPDRQAFLASVFSKSRSEEEELEWGSEAINEEKRMQTFVQVFLVLNGILIASIIAMIIYLNSK